MKQGTECSLVILVDERGQTVFVDNSGGQMRGEDVCW